MRKILIVDDNPKNIQLLGSILSEKDYEIEYAQNGVEAVEIVKTENFDLILMDVMMPEMDGYEACRIIKKMESKSEIPLIFITSNTDIESITHGFECGGVDYISKPFNTPELLARVKTHIELKVSKDKLKDVNKVLERKVEERTSDLRESNEKLKKANEELSVLDQAKTKFLNILSHEIRTPLNGIIGFLQLLKTRIDDENLIRLLLHLETSVKRLERFSFDALLITSLNAQKRKITLTKVDVFKQLEYQLMNFNEQISEKKLTFNLENFQQKLIINTDSELLTESLKRIIDNAIVFSDENSEISISNIQTKEHNTITIADQGRGFIQSILDKDLKIFSPGEEHIDQNVGVDLYLVNLIMKSLKGKLEYGNNKGKGAFVKLYFKIIE